MALTWCRKKFLCGRFSKIMIKWMNAKAKDEKFI